VFAGGVEAVEYRVDQRVRAALDQRQQPQLRMTGGAGPTEGSFVEWGVGDVDTGPVPGHHLPAERGHAAGVGAAGRAADPVEQRGHRRRSQASACLGQRWAGRHDDPGQVPKPIGQPAHHRPVARRRHAVRAAEQAQPENEVHHRTVRQQPAAALPGSRRGDHLVNERHGQLLGQHSQPQWQPVPCS
jgi:hypothetical protein